MEFSDTTIAGALSIFDSLPHFVWWKDTNFRFRLLNKPTAELLGFVSSDISYNKIPEGDVRCDVAELANKFENQEKYVIKEKKNLSTICFGKFYNDQWKIILSHKHPIYNSDNKIIGVSGTSFDVTECTLIKSAVLLIINLENLTNCATSTQKQFTYSLNSELNCIKLTNRESECLFLLLRGMTAKEIARFLNLSPKSTQAYLANVKMKLNCSTKSELIEKARSLGIGNILPKGIMNLSKFRS